MREANRLETCADTPMTGLIRSHLGVLEDMETMLETQAIELIENDPELNRRAEVMMKQKGVGQKTANAILSHMPELGTLTRQQVAALAGVAPHARESGKWQGKRRIYGGRAAVRKAMYMAAKTAAQWCPVISEFYKRLRANGKPYNVALIACARKMLIRLNTLLKQIPDNQNTTNKTATT